MPLAGHPWPLWLCLGFLAAWPDLCWKCSGFLGFISKPGQRDWPWAACRRLMDMRMDHERSRASASLFTDQYTETPSGDVPDLRRPSSKAVGAGPGQRRSAVSLCAVPGPFPAFLSAPPSSPLSDLGPGLFFLETDLMPAGIWQGLVQLPGGAWGHRQAHICALQECRLSPQIFYVTGEAGNLEFGQHVDN